MEQINRDTYVQELLNRENNGFIKVITGVRRSGKSYLLFRLFVDRLIAKGVQQDHIIALALDDIQNDIYREPHALYNHIHELITDSQTYYVLLDEIQFVDRFAEVLNSLLRIENVDVYVTGSNSKFLSSDILTEFRGRGDELRIYPLSFAEYLSAYDGAEEDALNEYMTFGGLPRILSFDTDERKSAYLTSLFAETYLKDIIEHNRIRNTAEMEDLVNILASSIGSLTNPHKLQKTFKSVMHSEITDKTITAYIDYLKDAFLISTAQRYDVKGRRYIGSPMKYYFVDLGLRNARLGFRQVEETHLMENMIFVELQRRGFSVDVGVVDTLEPSKNPSNGSTTKYARKRLEIDFVAYKGNQKYYIQSAFALGDPAKRAQEIRPLLHVDDSFKKVVIVGTYTRPQRDENGILTLGIRQFLKDENSLEL